MFYDNINNVTFEGHDFTESYIASFSIIILNAAMKAGLRGAVSSAKTAPDGKMYRPFGLCLSLPDNVHCVVSISNDAHTSLLASAEFFSVNDMARQTSAVPFEGHSAIAFLQFRFDVLGESLVERDLASARMLIVDGFADQMFVAMMSEGSFGAAA